MSDYFAPGDRVTVTWSGGTQESGVLERAESWTVTLPDGSCEVVEAAAVRRPAETAETEDGPREVRVDDLTVRSDPSGRVTLSYDVGGGVTQLTAPVVEAIVKVAAPRESTAETRSQETVRLARERRAETPPHARPLVTGPARAPRAKEAREGTAEGEQWRTGGKNPYTVYRVAEGERDEQHARDHFLGSFRDPDDARRAVDAVNAAPGWEYPVPRSSETVTVNAVPADTEGSASQFADVAAIQLADIAISRDDSGHRTVWLRTVVGEAGLKYRPEIKPGETTWHQLQGTGEHVRALPVDARPVPDDTVGLRDLWWWVEFEARAADSAAEERALVRIAAEIERRCRRAPRPAPTPSPPADTEGESEDSEPSFDWQAAEEGYAPCARGQWCELQLVRPGKVQCDCDSPGSDAALRRAEAEAADEAEASDRSVPVSGAAVPDGGADPDATSIARRVLAEDETVELVARKYHRFVDPMVPSLSEKDDETREAYRAEARKALRAALDVPGAPSPLAEIAGLLAEVAGLLDCTPDQLPARVRGLLDEQRGGGDRG